jgi:DNA-binding LacI/PurR family transcriptional regulator
VPADLAIVGFDNLDIAEQLSPPLTTLSQQFLEIGQKTADVLLRRIQGDTHPYYQVTISPELIVRESCLPYAQMQAPLAYVDQMPPRQR